MILLPWITGTLFIGWLLSTGKGRGHRLNWLLAIGLGYFIGLASLGLLMYGLLALSPVSRLTPIYAAYLIAIPVFGYLLWRTRLCVADVPVRAGTNSNLLSIPRHQVVLAGILVTWAAAHMMLSAFDVSSWPLFSWDAWTTWVYRSKLWFQLGGLVPMLEPAVWLQAPEGGYPLSAYSYPKVPSLIYLWQAWSAGAWEDGWVVLPYWLAGVAVGVGLMGMARELTQSWLAGLIIGFGFISLPIVGAHMSLGGYADLFVTGLSGLGLALLLLWARQQHSPRPYLLLGLICLLLAVLFKREGWVWLSVGLVYALSQRLSSRLLIGLFLTGLVLLSLTQIGLDVPALGSLGVVDGVLHLPGIGTLELDPGSAWSAVLDNLLVKGSWHLLGWLMLLSIIASLLSYRVFQVSGAMLGLISLALIVIFVLSPESKWANDNTALNRVMLQATPALFLSVLAVWTDTRAGLGSTRNIAFGPMAVNAAWALAAMLSGALVWSAWQLAPDPQMKPLAYTSQEMRLVRGGGKWDSGLLVNRFDDGLSVVSIRSFIPDAGQHEFVRIGLQAKQARGLSVAFYWRNKGSAQISSQTLTDREGGLLDLRSHPDWNGEIEELGLIVRGQPGAELRVEYLSLEAANIQNILQHLVSSWFEYEPWQQHSVNYLDLGSIRAGPSLTMMVGSWLVIWGVITIIRSPASLKSGVLVVGLLGWLILDVRWMLNLAHQAADTHNEMSAKTWEQRYSSGYDGDYYQWFERLKTSVLPTDPAPVFLFDETGRAESYYRARVPYLLIPHKVFNHGLLPASEYERIGGYLLVLGSLGSDLTFDRRAGALLWAGQTLPATLVDQDPLGLLFKIGYRP